MGKTALLIRKARNTPLRAFPAKLRARSLYEASKFIQKYRLLLFPPLPGPSAFKDHFTTIGNLRDDLFLRSFHDRVRESHFFCKQTAREILERANATLGPSNQQKIVSCAEDICSHRFDLLGSGSRFAGDPINWLRELKSGRSWPLLHRDHLPLGYSDGSDIIVVWELSRFQHVPTLGKASLITGDGKYLQEFQAQIETWLSQNPFGLGPNWYSSQDVAIRALSWISGYYFFFDQAPERAKFWMTYLRVLFAHGGFIRDNLDLRFDREGRRWTNTHYLSSIAGLIHLGTFFQDTEQGKEWFAFGKEELFKELGLQVHSDGVDYESSVSCYHRFALEHFLSGVLTLSLSGHDTPQPVLQRLERMCEFVFDYLNPDGKAPQIGDSADGRVHIFSEYPYWDRQDHRYILSVASEIFGREDFGEKAGRLWEESLWLTHKLKRQGRIPFMKSGRRLTGKSNAYPEGGFYFMKGPGCYTAISANRVGMGGLGNHKHNDIFSLELSADGATFLVDPGTYCYTPCTATRNLFRSTRYHNVLQIDAEEVNPFDPKVPFRMKEEACPKVLQWQSNEEYDLFEGEHYAYRRLAEPIIHNRRIFFSKKDRFWIIRDEVVSDPSNGKPEHVFDEIFHLGPFEVRPSPAFSIPSRILAALKDRFNWEVRKKNPELAVEICANPGRLLIVPMTDFDGRTIERGRLSPRYGLEEEAPILVYRKTGSCPATFVFALYPAD